MSSLKKKLITCPYCNESRFYNTFDEFEIHRKKCPKRYQYPNDRFKAKLNIK